MDNEQAVDLSVQTQAPIVESSDSSNVSSETASAPTPAHAPEKTFTQSQVQAIAAKEARKAAENARAAEAARYEQERAQSQSQSHSPSIGGVQQNSPEQIRQLIQEEAYKMSRQAMAQKIEQDWLSAMNAEKDVDPEFADLYDALNIEAHPDLILWMNGMDNKAAIVKDIAKNPSKFSNILMLARSGSPQLAQMELRKLSASIAANEAAKKQPQADAPLSQIKPSNIGSDNGDMSVSDYRLMFRG